MADPSPPANGAGAVEADAQPIPRTDAALQIEPSLPNKSQHRPKSAHFEFQESRRWARSNAEWIDNGNVDDQHKGDLRRASEDLLRPKPLTSVSQSEESPPLNHQRIPSEAGSHEQAHYVNCLSRPLGSGNWLNLRGKTAHHKIHVHHQFNRLVRRLIDTSNWSSREPPSSANEDEEPQDTNNSAPAAPNPKPKRSSSKRDAKLNKKPGMDNIRALKEAADKTHEKHDKTDAGGVINLNAAEDNSKPSTEVPTLHEQDIKETQRRSAELREVLSEYRSDRHGNLLPAINMDAVGDFSALTQNSHEQPLASYSSVDVPAAGPSHTAEQCHASELDRGLEPLDGIAWKASHPGSDKPVPRTPLVPPQPGPRISSRLGPAISSTVRRVDRSPLIGRSGLFAPGESPRAESTTSFASVIVPAEIGATGDQDMAAHLREQSSVHGLFTSGLPPKRSTDTPTAITVEALRTTRPLTPSRLSETESVALKPSTKPAKLYSGYISSGRAPGDAPDRPLPDLPEVPSPTSPERLRWEASSRASSRSGHSVHRLVTQPGHTRRTSSMNSISSLNGVLQATNSPQGSPHRKSRSVRNPGSVRSSSQKRLSGLSTLKTVTGSESASLETSFELDSPGLDQSHDSVALERFHIARETASRDQRIHDKRLHDTASARATRGKREMRRDHKSIKEDPTAEDFPSPPSSRPSSRATIQRQNTDPKSRAQTANIGAVYLPNGAGLPTTQTENVLMPAVTAALPDRAQASQESRATNRSRGGSPAPAPVPIREPIQISSVLEPQKGDPTPIPRPSHVSLRSNATTTHSNTIHATQTPPLSESSTPSSDEDGGGVVGAAMAASKSSIAHKRVRLSRSDLATMVADMHAMREQLDVQRHQIHTQSKQLRTIEMQKLRMVDAVNALVAVISEPGGPGPLVVSVSSSPPRKHDRQEGGGLSLNHHHRILHDRPDRNRNSTASTSNNTTASAGSAGSDGCNGSRASDATFITEPDLIGGGNPGSLVQEGMVFEMDFDRMHELIRLDRKMVEGGWGGDRDGVGEGDMVTVKEASGRRKSAGAVGYSSIKA